MDYHLRSDVFLKQQTSAMSLDSRDASSPAPQPNTSRYVKLGGWFTREVGLLVPYVGFIIADP